MPIFDAHEEGRKDKKAEPLTIAYKTKTKREHKMDIAPWNFKIRIRIYFGFFASST